MDHLDDSRSEVIPIRKTDPMPDTCCRCGMFTYDRVTVKYVDEIVTTKSNDGCVPILLAVVLHVFLGPIGWLIHLFLDGTDGKQKTIKKKSKLKIGQCVMCQDDGPPTVEASRDGVFWFRVHPKFKVRFEELQTSIGENEEDDPF
ncbi:MAG: hypothetical protein AAF939_00235 [Planctomycetota bacterium]